MKILNAEEFETLIDGHMGLIFGPMLSGTIQYSGERLFGKGGPEEFTNSATRLISDGIKRSELQTLQKNTINQSEEGASVKKFAESSWSACISCSLDTNFDNYAARYYTKRTTAARPIIVERGQEYNQSRGCFPIYKFLGSFQHESAVLTKADFQKIQKFWRIAVTEFAFRVRAHPVLLVGFSDHAWLVEALLSEMTATPQATPAQILFLRDELSSPLTQFISEMCDDRTTANAIDCTLSQLASKLQTAKKSGYTPLLQTTQHGTGSFKKHDEILTCVNNQISPEIDEKNTELLLDILFSPEINSWEPFAYSLDFKRPCSSSFYSQINKEAKKTNQIPAYFIFGNAACGKSTVMKRVSLDLAKNGDLVFWLKQTFFYDFSTRLAKFLGDLKTYYTTEKLNRVIIFIDDIAEIGLGSISIFLNQLSLTKIRIKLVISCRSIEWQTFRDRIDLGHLQIECEETVDDQLNDNELDNLPSYLARIGIYPCQETAKLAIRAINARDAKYILGVLFWLIPQTAEKIRSSIKSEHLRLGEQQLFSSLVIAGMQCDTGFIRKAYEFTAVCDMYRTPIPIEVLCSALGVSFGDWNRAISTDSNLWGLLYAEISEDGETYCYRTRNSIISQTIVESVNGGVTDKGGEVTILTRLLSTCNGGSSIYRSFARRILARNERFESLRYNDGLALYDSALTAIGDDRTILHQKARWVKKGANDPLSAIPILDKALQTPEHGADERGEREEHIRNTKAAVYLDAARQKQMLLTEVAPLILRELDKAKSHSFFNPNAVHVHARLIRDLLKEGFGAEGLDSFHLIARATSEIDAALSILETPSRNDRGSKKDIEYLKEVQGQIFGETFAGNDLQIAAKAFWDSRKSQWGFVSAARRLLFEARTKNNGALFNAAYNYALDSIKVIQQSGKRADCEILAVACEIFFTWQTMRSSRKGAANEVTKIGWTEFAKMCAEALQSPSFRSSNFHRFMFAVGLAQSQEWAASNTQFNELRRVRMASYLREAPRAIYLNKDGLEQRFQGSIVDTPAGKYFNVLELEHIFRISRPAKWPPVGQTTDAFIVFSYDGAFAQLEHPFD